MSDDDLDWFDKDEEDDVAILRAKLQQTLEVERIKGPAESDEYLKQRILEQSSQALGDAATLSTSLIPIADLRRMQNLSPLDMFLAAITHDKPFFVKQLKANDSQERVLLYINVLCEILNLQLPGFHQEILQNIANDGELLEHLRAIGTKLFALGKNTKSPWSGEEILKIVGAMQTLLLRLARADLLQANGFKLLRDLHTWMTIKSHNKEIMKLPLCREFQQQIQLVLEACQSQVLLADQLMCNVPLHPCLKDLLASPEEQKQQPPTSTDPAEANGNNETLDAPSGYAQSVANYLLTHKVLLRNSFLNSTRACVQAIRQGKALPLHRECHDNVCIVLNENFLTAHRHEMLFVDMLGPDRAAEDKPSNELLIQLNAIKTGSMLVFSGSRDFENLILACVTYTDKDILQQGYIGIEIVYQCNIANIYNKKLLMFETPEFYEPSNNVYNFLQNCNVAQFPMQEFIIGNQTMPCKPSYMSGKEQPIYEYKGQKFNPLDRKDMDLQLPLNESQKRAFCNALSHNMCLIQGPPGTGKTHVSTRLVEALIHNAPSPLIVITYTNESLDKFLLQLTQCTDSIVRFGSQTRQPKIAQYNVRQFVEDCPCNPQLKRLYFLVSTEYKGKFEQLQQCHKEFDGTDESYHEILKVQHEVRDCQQKLHCIRAMFQFYVAKEKKVLAMTTTCAAKLNFLFQLLKSQIVIFEEAAEISESHVVACLTPYTQHVIMIGDHMQLRPFSSSLNNCQTAEEEELKISLFERLIRRGMDYNQLTTQYRMRPPIADLLCPTIYETLTNDASVHKYKNIKYMRENLFFLDCKSHESTKDLSVLNEYEAMKIVYLANILIRLGQYTCNDVVILSPYAAQIAHIRDLLQQDAKLNRIKACTVDSFQGLEANIVLLSLVRSNDNHNIGFLEQKNRICVALSRAKQGLYIVGDLQLLAACSPTWQQIRDKLSNSNSIGSAWPVKKWKPQ